MVAKDVSVIIVSYGYGHLVGHCIESILSQTRQPEKILVVDDGAHDGVDGVATKYSVPFLIRPQNLGTAKNFDDIVRNHIETKRAMFLGADNWLREDAIEKMSSQNADIVSSDIYVTGELKESWANKANIKLKENIWHFVKKDINEDNYIHGSSLFNAEIAKEFGCRGNNINGMCVDWELWKDIMNSGGTHKHINEPLLYYRRHRNNFSKI